MSELSSLGPIFWAAIGLGIALLLVSGFFQVILLWPARLINHLAGKSPQDDFGGKTIALSTLTGPVCIGLLIWILELPKGDYLAWVVGWLVGIWCAAKLLDEKPKP